jgi:hypothetical protein
MLGANTESNQDKKGLRREEPTIEGKKSNWQSQHFEFPPEITSVSG